MPCGLITANQDNWDEQRLHYNLVITQPLPVDLTARQHTDQSFGGHFLAYSDDASSEVSVGGESINCYLEIVFVHK
nr:hypothetical protein [Mycobacterium uberis]